MKPFYFGSSQSPLFGIYHTPNLGLNRAYGVVLCNPMGDESVQGHRAFRQLAIHMARAGFHVLRFDYYGSGDSAGESEEADINQWQIDISTAIEELKEISGIDRICLIGARLGATLAASVGFLRNDVNRIVLWDPIINGKRYVKELMATQHKWRFQHDWMKDPLLNEQQDTDYNASLEVQGFPLTQRLCKELENIDLLKIQQCLVQKLFIVGAKHDTTFLALKTLLATFDLQLDIESRPEPPFWSQRADDSALVPIHILHSIISWISEDSL